MYIRGSINFPKIYKPPQNSGTQKGDMKQIQFLGPILGAMAKN